jgi:hypothetical protein
VAQFNPDHKAVLDELILGYTHVRPGKMFGFPAYYAGKKLCICLYEGGVGIKLPEASAVKLLDSDQNARPFQPMGKAPMREWIQIDLDDSDEYRKYVPVFMESIHYLLKQQGKKHS